MSWMHESKTAPITRDFKQIQEELAVFWRQPNLGNYMKNDVLCDLGSVYKEGISEDLFDHSMSVFNHLDDVCWGVHSASTLNKIEEYNWHGMQTLDGRLALYIQATDKRTLHCPCKQT